MCTLFGALAQLGEHLLCKQGVIGSIPIGSTIPAIGAICAWRLSGGKRRTAAQILQMMKTPYPACNRVGKVGWEIAPASFFDIVNGFLIDAVAHGL